MGVVGEKKGSDKKGRQRKKPREKGKGKKEGKGASGGGADDQPETTRKRHRQPKGRGTARDARRANHKEGPANPGGGEGQAGRCWLPKV